MKVITFNYTDAKNKQSTRTLAVSIEPTDKYAGTDLTELTVEELASYAKRFNQIHANYMQERVTLQEQFDLNHRYRQFSAEQMASIEVDFLA